MRKKYPISILLTLAALLTACAAGIESKPVQIDAPTLAPATAPAKVVTLIPEAELTLTPRPAVTRPDPIGDEQARETAAASLRELLGAPGLERAIQGSEASPNASNYPAAVFADPAGNRYYISQDTLRPIEFTLEQPIQETPGEPKTPDELRAIAFQLAQEHSSRFNELQEKLAYSEGNKGGENSFFRWELPGTNVGGKPAILQIGLKQDGSLFSYLNSIDLLK